MQVLSRPPSGWPALVLNADFRPLSYYPLSIWPWEEVVKAVYQDRVDVVSTYDRVVRSPSIGDWSCPASSRSKSYRGPGPPARLHPLQCLPARRFRLPRIAAPRPN